MATSDIIKKPHAEVEFDQHMIDELARCAEPVISDDAGPLYFIRKYVKIQHPTRGELPFELYDFQVRMIESYMNNRWCVTLTSRQVGKTTVAAAYLLWKAIFVFDFNILIASRRGDDAKDIMLKIKYAYESLPDWLRPGVKEYNVKSVMFDNGSQ